MTGLADCNNFFVSCERSVNPSLEGLPVVVLSNNDGCAIARSNEAKRLGIKMGQPAFEIKDLINSGRVIALSGNHLLYRRKSLAVHDIFRKYVPYTLDYSVDEAFLDVSGIPVGLLKEIGEAICDECWASERIPVTIGFAPTKTLAKIATSAGKKRALRVVCLKDETEFAELIGKMPIGDLWGIGRRLTKRLYSLGVFTVADFSDRPLSWIRKVLGVNGERTWLELHGKPCIELDNIGRSIQDSISETRTFPIDVDDFDWLRARIAIYSSHVSKRLRDINGQCSMLTVFLRSNRFHLEKGYFAPEASFEFVPPVNDTATISTAATRCLERIFTPQVGYKRGGVILSGISPLRSVAPSLFEDVEYQNQFFLKTQKLMKAIDCLNNGAGEQKLKLAAQLSKGIMGHNDGYSSSFGPSK